MYKPSTTARTGGITIRRRRLGRSPSALFVEFFRSCADPMVREVVKYPDRKSAFRHRRRGGSCRGNCWVGVYVNHVFSVLVRSVKSFESRIMIVNVQRRAVITWLAFALVSAAYLAQIATPLRLVNDGVDYLLQASSVVDGAGFRVHGQQSMRPPGYPALIVVLEKVGLGTSWAIVALNCLLLGVGCWVSYFLLRHSFGFEVETARLMCLLTLLSFVMVRNVTYPLSDISYFGASCVCLLIVLQAETGAPSRRFWRLILAVPLVVFCIELRTIGIALIPAFVWATIGGVAGAKKVAQWLHQHKVASSVFLLLIFIAILGVASSLLHSRYFVFNFPIFQRRGLLGSLLSNLRDHTTEWGELTINAPTSKLPRVLGFPTRIIGLSTIFLFAFGIWRKAKKFDSLDWYVLGYACIVLTYPWYDARLWLPLVPLSVGYILIGLRCLGPLRVLRPIVLTYCALYCLLGVVALGYSTRLTFAGRRFPDLYGDGRLADTYRVGLLGERPRNANDVSQDALYLLRRYEWRLAPNDAVIRSNELKRGAGQVGKQ